MELTLEICQRLKSAMESRNITGYTIHKALGISATTIGNYLNGKITNADNTKMKAICLFLKIDIVWLETGEKSVICESNENEEEYDKGNTEYILEQILLIITANSDQLKVSRKDTCNILDVVNSMKKDIATLKKEVKELKAENKRLNKKKEKDI